MPQTHPALPGPDPHHLAHRVTEIGWALFLILTGVVWLVPPDRLPPGTWLLATGGLLIGLNLARVGLRLPGSPALMVLGSLAVLAGLFALLGIKVSLVAVCLIILGGSMLLREVKRSR